MIRAIYAAASGMSAQQTNLDTIANNLANSATAGFRQRQVQFEDMIYQNLITPGSAETQQTLSAGLQVGLGTKSAASEVIMTQGDFNKTGNTLDIAIQGAGFFQVSRPDGTIAYTRAGNFHMNNQGTIVTAGRRHNPPRDHHPLKRNLNYYLSIRSSYSDTSGANKPSATRNNATRHFRQSRRFELRRQQSP